MSSTHHRRAASALALAISRAGGTTALARALGITASAVSQWEICPLARVLDVEHISDVSRHDLRPDAYPETGPGEPAREPRWGGADSEGGER